MKYEKEVHEAANQFDAMRYREVRAANYDLERNKTECTRLRKELEGMLKSDTNEMPSLDSDMFALVGEAKYLQEERAQKIKLLEAVIAEQIAKDQKAA